MKYGYVHWAQGNIYSFIQRAHSNAGRLGSAEAEDEGNIFFKIKLKIETS